MVVSLGLGDDVEVIVLDTTNDGDVETAVKRARVVINCVGPFWRIGFGVVRCVLVCGIMVSVANCMTVRVQQMACTISTSLARHPMYMKSLIGKKISLYDKLTV